jgi:hypothetical protein
MYRRVGELKMGKWWNEERYSLKNLVNYFILHPNMD